MKILERWFKPVKEFFVQYPALLSGYIIYGYFFISTMDFYRDFKRHSLDPLDFLKNFDALIWMWLLAYALVKVIEYRNKLHEKLREVEMQHTQLETMQAVIRTLQHEINNPLAIILAYAQKLERVGKDQPVFLKGLGEIREGADRISKALSAFSNARGLETVQSSAGKMAKPTQEP